MSNSPFYEGTPGQKLAEIIEKLSERELHTIVGDDGTSLITAISNPKDKLERMRRMATNLLQNQSNGIMFQDDVREICWNYMSDQKRDELIQRLELSSSLELSAINLSSSLKFRRKYLEFFFGFDLHETTANLYTSELVRTTPKFGLFPHQRRTMRQVCAALRGGHGRVVLHMPTGSGKTRTAMHIICQFLLESEPSLVVWLATSEELLEQAFNAFQSAWPHLGNREVQSIRFWGNHNSSPLDVSDGIIVAGLKKMSSLLNRDRIKLLRLGQLTNLVVVDEAHQAIAPTYKEVIVNIADAGKHTALLGLTATPGRTYSDIDADKLLSEFFSNRKITLQVDDDIDPITFLVNQGYLAKPKFNRIEVNTPLNLKNNQIIQSPNGDYRTKVLETLAENCERNKVILDEIIRLVDEGHKRIILFAASVRHAEVIDGVLNALNFDCRIVTAQSESKERKRIIRLFRGTSAQPVILSNYGVLTTGFDAPNTSAAVIARPTRSLVLFSQMVGRAIRGPKAGGNEHCTISTVVDTNLPGFGDVAEAFTNWEDVWHEPK